MKQRIAFQAATERSSGALLLHLAIVLRQLRLELLTLHWSTGRASLDVGMLVFGAEHRARELVAALQATDGVGNVVLVPEGSRIPSPDDPAASILDDDPAPQAGPDMFTD